MAQNTGGGWSNLPPGTLNEIRAALDPQKFERLHLLIKKDGLLDFDLFTPSQNDKIALYAFTKLLNKNLSLKIKSKKINIDSNGNKQDIDDVAFLVANVIYHFDLFKSISSSRAIYKTAQNEHTKGLASVAISNFEDFKKNENKWAQELSKLNLAIDAEEVKKATEDAEFLKQWINNNAAIDAEEKIYQTSQNQTESASKQPKKTKNETRVLWLVVLASLIAAIAVPQSRRIFVLMTVVILEVAAAFQIFDNDCGPGKGIWGPTGVWKKVKGVLTNVVLALFIGYSFFIFLLAPVYWFAYPGCPADVTALWPDAHTGVAPPDESVSDFFSNINDSRCPDTKVLGSLQYIVLGVWLVAALRPSWKIIKYKAEKDERTRLG